LDSGGCIPSSDEALAGLLFLSNPGGGGL